MKLSKSKLALAKVINENGGWPDSGSYAAQVDNGAVWTSQSKPIWIVGGFRFSMDYCCYIATCELINNRHQAILSREEYYQAYPKADADGWIEWQSPFFGEMPVCENEIVDIRVGDDIHTGFVAKNWKMWGVVTHYRLHKPEVKHELCESVMRSIPEPEEKPTIEQLAQDYRNAVDYAERLQKEADEAKAAADAALGELERAGEALGLLIGISSQAPELVIAGWRDLRIGDEVECTEYDYAHRFGVVCRIDESSEEQPIMVDHGDSKGISWPSSWKFIRRP